MANVRGIMEKILELADNPETLRNPKGIYFTVTEPSDVLMNVFKEEGIDLLSIKTEATFFAPNEVLEKFRKEKEDELYIQRRDN